MPPREKPAPAQEATDTLTHAVTDLSVRVDALNGLIGGLQQRMAVLTGAIDDIRQEFEYAVRNDRVGRSSASYRHVSSVPIEATKPGAPKPSRPSAAERQEEDVPESTVHKPRQRDLWDD